MLAVRPPARCALLFAAADAFDERKDNLPRSSAMGPFSGSRLKSATARPKEENSASTPFATLKGVYTRNLVQSSTGTATIA